MENALDKSGDASAGNASRLAHSVKQIVAKHLANHLKKLFSSIDDSLFEYADKAGNNQQQSEYFSAMRDIRKGEKTIQQGFFGYFNGLFDDALKGISFNDNAGSHNTAEFSHTTLSLVDEEELEESLAVTNMIEKAHGMYREDLLAISQRFSHMYSGMEFKSETCPPSPNNICHAFEQATEKLSLDLEIKLIVFKLFDKFVVTQVGPMYREINDMFVNAGILPTIKLKSPVKSQEQQAKPKPEQQQPQAAQAAISPAQNLPTDSGEVSFDSLRQLLSMHRGEAPAANADSGTASGGEGGTGGGAGGGASGYYVTDDVLSGLTDLQSGFLGGSAEQLQHVTVEEIKNGILEALGKSSADKEGKAIEGDESDVIDLVSMMFEFILEDKSLSDRIRAEIARLQIPIIKVAIIDKKFFDLQNHPARLLLNELAYAGGSRDMLESDDDVIFRKIEYVVNRVLTEFQTNVDIFSELLEEFKQFVDKELQSNKVSEKRLEQTKQKVSDEIESRIKKYKIPKLIYDFLVIRWKDVLTTVGMRNGCSGQTWNACLGVIDDLIWSVQPKLMTSERQQLTRSIPKLLKRLQEGMKFIATEQAVIDSFLDQLGALHLKCLKGASDLLKKTDPLAELEAELNEASKEDPADDGNPFADDLPAGDFEYFSGTDDFSMIQLTPEIKRSKQYPVVRDMEMGTWVEFTENDKTRRGRLSWKCDFTGDYTFVDRRYRLVVDISTSDLVKRLEQGAASVVTEVPLLDRAIDAVISTMTKCLQSANNLVSPASG